MRVEQMLRPILNACRPIHAARLSALTAAVAAVVHGGRLTLTDIGRSYSNGTAAKHSIKRADRLVGNHHLWVESDLVRRALAYFLVRGVPRPVVLIDWTGVGIRDDWYALVATIPVAGRGVPILAEVHPGSRHGNRAVQQRFLERLKSILPAHCRPVIVADAGFRMPFYRAVDALHWGYVIRVRGRRRRFFGRERPSFAQVMGGATDASRDLGGWLMMTVDCYAPRLVLGPKPRLDRNRRKTRSKPRRPAYSRLGREPWLLASNLWHHHRDDIIAIYATRMTIEEAFRDSKSHRCGWAFDYARSRQAWRLELLMLVGALATFVVMLVGLACERHPIARTFQANTIRHRRVLSAFRLGQYLLDSSQFIFSWDLLRSAAARLRFELIAITPAFTNGSFWKTKKVLA